MSDITLKDINVNSSSGEKTGLGKMFSELEGRSAKELSAFRALCTDYSDPDAVVSTIDISRLSINAELNDLPRKKLASITAELKKKLNLDLELTNEINLLRRKKVENLTAYEFISELERRKQYSVNAKFMVVCIDEYNRSKQYDLNNNPIEEEPFIDDENDDKDNGEASMGNLNLNREYQRA